MPTQPRMSLQTVAFNPTPFQAVTFTPQAADTSILAHSFDTIAQREKEASEKLGAMDTTFSQLRAKLHQDPETLKWFDDYTNAQKTKVKNYVDNYDFSTAINKAVELAGETLNNPELNARINANTTRSKLEETVYKRFQEGKIGKNTLKWWHKNNQFHYENIYDDATGKVIGGTDYNDDTLIPYDDLPEAEVLKAAKDFLEVHKTSTSRQSSTQTGSRGGDPGETTSITTSASGSSFTHEWNDPKELWDNMDAIIDAIPDGRARMSQQFAVLADEFQEQLDKLKALEESNIDGKNDIAINNLKQDIETRSPRMWDNDSIVDFKTYYYRTILHSELGKRAVRNWTTSGTSSEYSHVTDKNASKMPAGYGGVYGDDKDNNTDNDTNVTAPGPHGKGKGGKSNVDAAKNKINSKLTTR